MSITFTDEILIKTYEENDRNCAKTARALGINEKTVKRYLNEFGIDTSGHRHVDRYKFDYDYLLNLYIACNYNSTKLAKILGVSKATVKRHLDLHQIDTSPNIGNRKHFFNEEFFQSIDSEEKAYWLGFIMADGCVSKGSDPWSYRLYINLQTQDTYHLQTFLDHLNANYNIFKSFSREHILNDKVIKATTTSIIKVNSTKLCKDLIKIGITPQKTCKEIFPILPDSLYHHYIRGYFDGDGSICRSARSETEWHFNIVGSLESLVGIEEHLPYNTSIKEKKETTDGEILYSLTNNRMIEIKKIHDYLYEGATVFLSRKKETFNKFLSIYSKKY